MHFVSFFTNWIHRFKNFENSAAVLLGEILIYETRTLCSVMLSLEAKNSGLGLATLGPGLGSCVLASAS